MKSAWNRSAHAATSVASRGFEDAGQASIRVAPTSATLRRVSRFVAHWPPTVNSNDSVGRSASRRSLLISATQREISSISALPISIHPSPSSAARRKAAGEVPPPLIGMDGL